MCRSEYGNSAAGGGLEAGPESRELVACGATSEAVDGVEDVIAAACVVSESYHR